MGRKKRLEDCIEQALLRTRFRTEYLGKVDWSHVHELYAREQYREPLRQGINAIRVPADELSVLVSAISPSLQPFCAAGSDCVGNGLAALFGVLGHWVSPRFLSLDDYARMLVLAAARIGPKDVAATFLDWAKERPVTVRKHFLLEGVDINTRTSPRNGIVLEPLSGRNRPISGSLLSQLRARDITPEEYGGHVLLSLEYGFGPMLYNPDVHEAPLVETASHPSILNPELSEMSVDGLFRAMSLVAGGNVESFLSWSDYSSRGKSRDIDAFRVDVGSGKAEGQARFPASRTLSSEEFTRCLEIEKTLRSFSKLDVGIDRWRRSKSKLPWRIEEQLVELRVALEATLLAGNSGTSSEMQFRIATRGAWFLGRTYDERKACYDTLRKAYTLASRVLHGQRLKPQSQDDDGDTVARAQDLCRHAILKMIEVAQVPNWDEVMLGKGYRLDEQV